jgi:[ribosomal protein S18]-alanine N-acetyltransferase
MIGIRQALLSDIPRILEIEQQSFRHEAFPKRQFISLLKSKNSIFLVAESNHEISGYILLLKRKNCKSLRIYSIAVDPDSRGMQTGSKLLQKAELISEELNLKTISLEVHQQNHAAINFYLKHGFIIIKKIQDYYNSGEHAFKMKKTIPQ